MEANITKEALKKIIKEYKQTIKVLALELEIVDEVAAFEYGSQIELFNEKLKSAKNLAYSLETLSAN